MGFHETFISWIRILYEDIISVCLINGHQSDPFSIKRGVRQGCPLSMILYIISQEPLYQAIKQSKQIQPFNIPCRQIKLLGFADDTTVFVKTEGSISHIFEILKDYEKASSIKVNMKKTRVFGFGEWEGRINWPHPNMKVEISNITILGITFAHDINIAIDNSWSSILR